MIARVSVTLTMMVAMWERSAGGLPAARQGIAGPKAKSRTGFVRRFGVLASVGCAPEWDIPASTVQS